MSGGVGLGRKKGAHLFVEFGFAKEVHIQFGGNERFDDAAPGAWTHHHCPGPVPEEHAGGPIGPVRKAGIGI